MYLPYAQAPPSLRGQAEIKVNTLLDPAMMIPAIRDQVDAVARDMPPVEIVPDQELQDFEGREERSLARLLGGFGRWPSAWPSWVSTARSRIRSRSACVSWPFASPLALPGAPCCG